MNPERTPLTDWILTLPDWVGITALALIWLGLVATWATIATANQRRTLDEAPEPEQTEYEAWARRDRCATVHYTDEPWTPTRTAEQATVQQAEAWLADMPYNVEEEGL